MSYVLFEKLDNGLIPLGKTELSFSDILAKPAEILKHHKAPPYVNVYVSTYTVGSETNFPAMKARQIFTNQSIIPFDIDAVQFTEDKYQSSEAIVRLALRDTGLSFDDCAVLCSGNGVQFFFEVTQPLIDREQYTRLKLSYVMLIKKMQENIGTAGKVDPSVWSPARVMRMPGTVNQKPNRPDTEAFTIKASLTPVQMFLQEKQPEFQEIPQELPSHRLPDPDTEAVQEGCAFLKHSFAHQEKVSEPEWLALGTIVGRLEDGENLFHRYSEKHPGYNPFETSKKLAHALESGPRTCANISSMFAGCAKCPHFEQQSSPITIRGDLFCGTKDTGFHFVGFNEDGTPRKPVPDMNGLANHFIKQHRLKSTGEVIYHWDGDKYVEMDDQKILGEFHSMFRPQTATVRCAEETLKIVKIHKRIAVDRNEKLSERYLNFKNGILDKVENKFLPKDPKHFFRYCLDFNYDPSASSPLFDKFLSDVSCGDEEIAQCLSEFGGYALSGEEYRYHNALILNGLGANGKSKYIELLGLLAGEGNYSSLGIKDIADSNSARLMEGRLFNAADETPVDALRKYTELFKKITAGGAVKAHKKYVDSYEFKNRAKIIFACNEMPGIPGTDDGIARRLIIVPFNASFRGQRDNKFILDQMKPELAGIFNRMWNAYNTKTKERGEILIPKASALELEKVLLDSNPIASYFEICIQVTNREEDFISTRELFSDFNDYKHIHGMDYHKSSSNIFSKHFSNVASKKGVSRQRTHSLKGFNGIRFIAKGSY